MAAATVSLRHIAWTTDGAIHFYDGSLQTRGGVVNVPLSKPHWATKAWYDGYRLDAETGEPIPSMSEYIAAAKAKRARGRKA